MRPKSKTIHVSKSNLVHILCIYNPMFFFALVSILYSRVSESTPVVVISIVVVVILIGIALIKFIQGDDAIKYLTMALLLSVIAGIFVWIASQITDI